MRSADSKYTSVLEMGRVHFYRSLLFNQDEANTSLQLYYTLSKNAINHDPVPLVTPAPESDGRAQLAILHDSETYFHCTFAMYVFTPMQMDVYPKEYDLMDGNGNGTVVIDGPRIFVNILNPYVSHYTQNRDPLLWSESCTFKVLVRQIWIPVANYIRANVERRKDDATVYEGHET